MCIIYSNIEKKKFAFDEKDIVQNGLIVGFELYLIGEPLWFSMGMVALGELGVMIVGYILIMIIRRNKKFFEAVRATQNVDFKF